MNLLTTLVILSWACVAYSQTFVQITSDAQFNAQFKNPNYDATLVNYMTTTCTHSKYMKVLIHIIIKESLIKYHKDRLLKILYILYSSFKVFSF